jgi:hypothetical protein
VLGIERRYRAGTLILETEYETTSGRVRVTDWMPPRTDYPDLIRTVTGVRGEVSMRMELVIRFDYGDVIPWVVPCDGGIRAIAGPDMLGLETSVPLATTNEKSVSRFTVRPGQTDRFVLMWHPSHQTVINPIEPKCARAFLDHAESANLCPDWRDRRGAYDFAARMPGRAAQLGLPLLLVVGCDLHPLCLDAGGLYRGSQAVEPVAVAGGCRRAQLDRALRACEQFGLEGPVERWQALRKRIHRDVCEKGFDARRGSFVQYYGGKGLDASLLLIPLVGFLPPSDPRVLGTLKAIEHELMIDGFVARYLTEPEVDGLPAGEGAFLACSFWLADNYALVGRRADARALFERLLSLRSDLGLLAEQYDPKTRRLIGNYPQALSHIALVNTAYNLLAVKGPAHDCHA